MKTLLLSLLLTAVATGCAGYRVGSQLPPDIQTVFVHIPNNRTEEPLLENDVANAFLAQLQRDGSLRITSEEEADSIAFIEITGLRTEALAFNPANRSQATEYRLIIEANIILTRANGTTIVQSGTVSGRDVFLLSGDLTSSRRTALRPAADDLARRLVAVITEAWVM
jgi:outer membrane lipopolysaccharide assembly protein LptE/RlpB